MLQEFYIKNLKQSAESPEDLFQLMDYRLQYFKSNHHDKKCLEILNIPDLCYLVKESSPKNILNILSIKNKKVVKSAVYHYVYGLDTSNVAYISAYILKFIQKAHKSVSTYRITQSVFCVFDFFVEKDLRILIKFPGGVKRIFYVDNSSASDFQPENLKTVFLSSILRTWTYSKMNSSNSNNNIVFLEEINNDNTFTFLSESIEWLISSHFNQKLFSKDKISLSLKYYFKYLIDTRRFNYTIVFFNKLINFDSSFIRYAIEPLRLLRLYKDAMSYLANLCTSDETNHVSNQTLYNKQSSKFLWIEIDLLNKMKQYDDALKIAKYVTSINPENNEAWLSLCELYLNMKQYDNFLKSLNNCFLVGENEQTFNINITVDNDKSMSINEIPLSVNEDHKHRVNLFIGAKCKNEQKLKELMNIKINSLMQKPKKCIDIYYNSAKIDIINNFNDLGDGDFLQQITYKLLNSSYIHFNKMHKKAYSLLLELVKTINYDQFLILKRKIFNPSKQKGSKLIRSYKFGVNSLLKKMENNIYDNSSLNSDLTQMQHFSLINEMRITMSKELDMVIETLTEDLKLFSIIITPNNTNTNNKYSAYEKNYQNDIDNTLSFLRIKEELTITEIKFSINFAILCERLGYNETAINLYDKVLDNCFSKFVLVKKTSILMKENNYKQAIITIGKLLSNIDNDEFTQVNKTPLWLDKIILKVLYDYQASDIKNWLEHYEPNVIEYIKKIINKYKYWIEIGHEIHLVKN